MTIKDRIYGKVRIKEPILLKLLKSSPVLRLKNISQFKEIRGNIGRTSGGAFT